MLAHEQDQFATGITPAEATDLLRKDVRSAERAVLRLISVPLTDEQFDALVSFTFNLGAGALQRSTLRRKVNLGEHESTPAELMKWVWRRGKGCRGSCVADVLKAKDTQVTLIRSERNIPHFKI